MQSSRQLCPVGFWHMGLAVGGLCVEQYNPASHLWVCSERMGWPVLVFNSRVHPYVR